MEELSQEFLDNLDKPLNIKDIKISVRNLTEEEMELSRQENTKALEKIRRDSAIKNSIESKNLFLNR